MPVNVTVEINRLSTRFQEYTEAENHLHECMTPLTGITHRDEDKISSESHSASLRIKDSENKESNIQSEKLQELKYSENEPSRSETHSERRKKRTRIWRQVKRKKRKEIAG